ncbi:MAG: hypothetical protein IT299_01435 [Dehalococcoidia bacterium]|nr:hypothetical protein [Dehalococcoidia bacterium]
MADDERIPMHRAVAVIRPDSIAIRPSRQQLVIPLVQALIAGGAVWLLITFINVLPLWLLLVLLGISLLLGPAAVLGVVYSVYGTEFLVERRKGTARWHQGFLGLGIGTFELVPFERIERIVAESDIDDDLTSGQAQDLVELDVRLVKDNGRVLDVASLTTAHALLEDGIRRANRLAEALGEMTGRPVATIAPALAEVAAVPTRTVAPRRRPRRARARPGPEEAR